MVSLEGIWGLRERRDGEKAVKGGRGWRISSFLASGILPVTTLFLPPQAKLNISVRALETSALDLQVANGRGKVGKMAALRSLFCSVPLEGEGGGEGRVRSLRTSFCGLWVLEHAPPPLSQCVV